VPTRINLPVSQREFDYPESDLIVSTTDAQGRITHCNEAFVSASGYSYEELMGQPHNLIRHPDMPPEEIGRASCRERVYRAV
jgi:aerotaxis receptor